MNSCQPQWNQSFIYSGIRPPELRSRFLEVTVWDYDRFGSNEFLGEINLDLGATASGNNDEPIWHVLNMENNGMVRKAFDFHILELLARFLRGICCYVLTSLSVLIPTVWSKQYLNIVLTFNPTSIGYIVALFI